ncbi:ATP-dependent RNA helicase DbpA [Kineobactrum sediminis]|uniref:ATP-dependent RNA helicase DbpA n=1 Tax=Kineobactrum sediminis TaxID=1905677 RepID=A0A2N5Y4C3_9GAMM|nr:ATP-dependent RNA helicase DbpA [Kineobactrum sediminis]PLW83243.1 ATP-dependent RNA helicase DbpA [Kineobactrum sediminis]
MTTQFDSLGLQAGLLANLATLGYHSMTPIQAKSLPPILAGQDVIGQGKTGSGKTAAFGLGLLHKLNVKHYAIQALVLCPTRELADQVAKEIRRLARGVENVKVLTLCGGMPLGPQIGSLEHGAHIIVGTPGRIEEHLGKGTLKLEHVNTLVLDEADRMLDMGFQPSLDAILEHVPAHRQTLLFSATFPGRIQAIAGRVMQDPVRVEVESIHDNASIEQVFHKVDDADRMKALRLLLLQHRPESAVIFCNTRAECQDVAGELQRHGFSVLALHGDLEQKDRDQTLVRFASKSVSVLVATDVAARGLDIDALDAVINFHIPRDLEVHVHRIGRTGRAGSKGIACTLYSDKESHKVPQLEKLLNQKIEPAPLPPMNLLTKPGYKPPMVTLQVDGGKKQKVRPGDILGALTGDDGIAGSDVGKIQVNDNWSFVAVRRSEANTALAKLGQGKMKGRNFRVRVLG